MKKLVVLTGAGVSAESGISTFRDANGLWEGHDVMQVASPEGWHSNPEVVLNFYNQRRRQLINVLPNNAHVALAELERDFDVHIITQNVDDLHERAGSSKVLHLHGELKKARSTTDDSYIIPWEKDLLLGDCCPKKGQLRPHIVWFGEAVPAIEEAMSLTQQADILLVVGTSLQVYPAAGLLDLAKPNIPVFYIDPKPAPVGHINNPVEILAKTATQGMPIVQEKLQQLLA